MTDPRNDDQFTDTPADTDSETTEDTRDLFADFLARTARETTDLDQYAERVQRLIVEGLQESVDRAASKESAVTEQGLTASGHEVPLQNRATPEQGWRRIAVGLGPCSVTILINHDPGRVRYSIDGQDTSVNGIIHGPTKDGVSDLLDDVKDAIRNCLSKRRHPNR